MENMSLLPFVLKDMRTGNFTKLLDKWEFTDTFPVSINPLYRVHESSFSDLFYILLSVL